MCDVGFRICDCEVRDNDTIDSCYKECDAHNATIIWSWDSQKNWIQPSHFFLSKKTPHYSSFTKTHSIHSFLFCGAWPTLCFISMQCLYPAFYSSCINNEFKTRTISKSPSYYIYDCRTIWKKTGRQIPYFPGVHVLGEQGSIFTADSNPAASLRLPSIADTNTPAGAIAAIPDMNTTVILSFYTTFRTVVYAAACVLWFLCTMNWNSGTWILMVIRSAQDGLQRQGSPNLHQTQTKPKK